MPNHWPTIAVIFHDLEKEKMGMHVCTFTDVYLVLVLDQPAENFEESCHVEQRRTDIAVFILHDRLQVGFFIICDPTLIIIGDSARNMLFNVQVHNLIIIGNLIL